MSYPYRSFELFLSTHLYWVKISQKINDDIVEGWVTTAPKDGQNSWFGKGAGRGDGRPVIVDNGAWGRFLRGEHKPLEEVFESSTAYGLELLAEGHEPRMVLLPDVVGDWNTTIENAWKCPLDDAPSLIYGLVLQDGWKYSDVTEFLETYPRSQLFVGGSDFKFKRYCVDEVHDNMLVDEIHVGRITSFHHMLWAHRHPLVRSIDNSTFTRVGQHNKYGGDVAGTLHQRISRVRSQQTLTFSTGMEIKTA